MSSGYFAPENPRGQRFEDEVPLTPYFLTQFTGLKHI